ncbi:hypothetical protein LSA88_002805 [Listeria monocytogenes]|nr:hypothetical protein [Listeria monocytogenes]EIP2458361.1 hypothetical protein [Listeria monocytogenes]EIP2514718.1 hypothetical protein [Listeria monocytogenes]EIR6790366.1 hypothetical protein [Listeria monocytogenes]EIR6803611.1 hypothetical protein [Listeria monocytogenes]
MQTNPPIRVSIRSTSVNIPRLERQVIRKLVIRLLRTNNLRYYYTDSKQHGFRLTREAEETIQVEGSRFWESLTLIAKRLAQQNELSLSTQVDDQQTITTAEWKG